MRKTSKYFPLGDNFKQLLDEDFYLEKSRSECYQPSQRPRLITLTETLIIDDITKLDLMIVLLDIVLRKIMTNTPLQAT